MDFSTVPTFTFRALYCFFVIEQGRSWNLHLIVTDHPTAAWIVRPLREAFPEPCPHCYAMLNRDVKFCKDVANLLISEGIKPKRTTLKSPWQNGIAERWIGGCRPDILDHAIILNETHFRNLLHDYLFYYHLD